MQIQIITSEQQLTEVFEKVLKRMQFSGKQVTSEAPDAMDIHQAAEYVGLSKSQMYKFTHLRQVPFRKFGNKLIFSRKALKTWKESKMTGHG